MLLVFYINLFFLFYQSIVCIGVLTPPQKTIPWMCEYMSLTMKTVLSHLLQIIKRTNVSLKMWDIVAFLDFLELLHLIQQIFLFVHYIKGESHWFSDAKAWEVGDYH